MDARRFVTPRAAHGRHLELPSAHPGQASRAIEKILLPTQLGLVQLALGDVSGDPQHSQDATSLVVYRRLDRLQQLPVAIAGKGHPFLVDAGAAGGDGSTVLFAEEIGQLGRHEIMIGLALDLCLACAEEPLETGVAG